MFRCLLLVFFVAPMVMPVAAEHPVARRLNLPTTPFSYAVQSIPPHAAATAARLDNTPADNPITDAGATLGRVLFYDVTLSANRTTSCASCHLQSLGFTDGRKTSIGHQGEAVRRNSMPLVNLRYAPGGRFFWDERAETLEQQVLGPIEDPIEMGHSLRSLCEQLSGDPIYPPLFRAAFSDSRVTPQRIAKSLAQFIRSIVSFGSPYDIGLAQVDSPTDRFANFTDEQNYGKQIFFGRAACAQCHLPSEESHFQTNTAFFQLDRPRNNGIDRFGAADRGVAEVTGQDDDAGRFRSSSLRNIDVTGPYMHDGRFHTIDQVIEHYNWSVKPSPTLDDRLRDFAENGMALPEVEKVALTEFLKTLTDQNVLSDPKFSDPFVAEH